MCVLFVSVFGPFYALNDENKFIRTFVLYRTIIVVTFGFRGSWRGGGRKRMGVRIRVREWDSEKVR